MPLRSRRPCDGKGSGNAHDEEELYFHCELSVLHIPQSLAPSQLPPPVMPAMRPLSSGFFSSSVLSQSPDTPHVSGPPKLRGPVAGCAFVCQRARCQKRHPGEELGSRQALDPRSLDSSGSSAHWISHTHWGESRGLCHLFPESLFSLFPRSLWDICTQDLSLGSLSLV